MRLLLKNVYIFDAPSYLGSVVPGFKGHDAGGDDEKT
jgi:hypothetical protein